MFSYLINNQGVNTHFPANLSASGIVQWYGNRIRETTERILYVFFLGSNLIYKAKRNPVRITTNKLSYFNEQIYRPKRAVYII